MARRTSQGDPALAIDFFTSGFYTYRSQLFAPFKAIGVNVVSFHDPVLDGANFELTDKLEWTRRPGFSIFCPTVLPDSEVVNAFYSSRLLTGQVLAFADTTQRLLTFTNTALTPVITKTTTAQGYVATIGNMSYFADGSVMDNLKYDSTNVTAWGLAAATIAPAASGMGFWQPDTGFALGNTILDTNGNIESVSGILASNGAIESPTDFSTVALGGGSGTWAGSVVPSGTVSVSLAAIGFSNYLFLESFNLAIPSDATIVGIVAVVPKQAVSGAVVDESVRLVINGAVVGTEKASVAAWNQSAMADTIYGGPLDMWGTSLTPAQANTNGLSGFGLAISANATSTNSIRNLQNNIANGLGVDIACSFVNPVTPGSTVVVGTEVFNETFVGISDDQGNVYHLATSSTSGESTTRVHVAYGVTAATGIRLSVASPASNAFGMMNIHEFAGVVSVSPIDSVAHNTAPPSSPFNSGTVTTANAQDMIFSFNFGAPVTPPTGGYIDLAYNLFFPYGGAAQVIGSAYLVVNATGSYSPTWSQGRIGCTVALKSAGVALPTIGGGAPNSPIITIYYKRGSGVGGPGLSADNEPTWSTTLSGSVNDGGLTWTNYGPVLTWYPLTAYATPVVVLDSNGFLQLGKSTVDPVAEWVVGTTYDVGETVSFGGGYWINTHASNTGIAPSSGYTTASVTGGVTTTETWWSPASNPIVTGSIAPVWNTALGGITEDGDYEWTNIGAGSGLAFVGHAYVYGYRTIYGHLTTSSPFSNNTGAILGPLQGSITGFSITSNVVTFHGNNNFLTGNVFTVSGLATGTYLNNQALTTIAGTPSSSFPLTSVAVTSNVVTVEALNNLVVGQTVTFQNVGTATFLNGQTVTVLASGLSSAGFEANFVNTDYGPAGDTGTVAVNGTWTAEFTHANVALVTDSGVAKPLFATVTGVGTASALCNSTAPITAVSLTANIVTVTASNNFQPGIWVTISGLTGAAFLNGLQFQVIAVDQPVGTQNTTFQFYCQHANYATTADSGTATFNAIEIYRTSDGGGSYLFDGAIANPGDAVVWTYDDFVPDADLNIALVAPLFHLNDPPPGAPGSTISKSPTVIVYWQGRLWMAVGNYVYFTAGPDCTNGIPEEACPPAYRYQFAGPVLGLKPTPDGVGLMVFLADRVNMILGGPETISFYPTDGLSNFGISNPNAVYKDGSTLGVFSTQKQYFEIAGNSKNDIGERIGDYLAANFSSAKTYATMHRDGLDVGVFLSNGVDRVVRFGSNISAWSVPAFPTFGAGALASIETSVGTYTLMIGTPNGGITSTAGPYNPLLSVNIAGTGTAWLTPGNVELGNPATYAVLTLPATGAGQILRESGYTQLTIPYTAVIQGVTVKVVGKQTTTFPADLVMTIQPTGGAGTSHSMTFGSGNTTLTFGGTTDLWGMDWTSPSIVNAGALSFDINSSFTSRSATVGGFGPFDTNSRQFGANTFPATSAVVASITPNVTTGWALLLSCVSQGGGGLAGWNDIGGPVGFVAEGLYVQSFTSAATISTTQGTAVRWCTNISTFQGAGETMSASGTSVQVAGNVVTIQMVNNWGVGTHVNLAGFVGANFLNAQRIQISSRTATSISGTFVHANYGPAADSGTGTYLPYIQFVQVPTTNGTHNVTLPNPTTFGSTIIVAFAANDVNCTGTLSSVSDGSSVYTILSESNGGGGSFTHLAYAQSVAAGSPTYAVNLSSNSSSSCTCYLIELFGAQAATTAQISIAEVQVKVTYQNPGNYLYARDLSSWGDAGAYGDNVGTPYSSAFITIGSVTMSQLGAPLFPLQHVVGYFDAVGTLAPGNKASAPNISILPNEISDSGSVPFIQLPEFVQEPPIGQNQPSTSLLSLRWPVNMLNSTQASQFVHHLQVKIEFEPENAPNTIKALAFKEQQD